MPAQLFPITLVAVLMLTSANATSASDVPPAPPDHSMTFAYRSTGGNCGDCRWLAAEGRITADTPARLKALIADRGLPDQVTLHSSGGAVLASLKMGALLRRHGVETSVQRTEALTDLPHDRRAPGICLSACAYAFLGGEQRRLPEQSVLGFHEHRLPDSKAARDLAERFENRTGLSRSQILTGAIAGYMSRMGVDARLLFQASTTPSDQIYQPTRARLIAMNAITPEPGWSAWHLDRRGDRLIVDTDFEHGRREMTLRLTCRNGGNFEIYLLTPHPDNAPAADELARAATPEVSIGDSRPTGYVSGDYDIRVRRGFMVLSLELAENQVDALSGGGQITLEPNLPRYTFNGTLGARAGAPGLPEARGLVRLLRRACPS